MSMSGRNRGEGLVGAGVSLWNGRAGLGKTIPLPNPRSWAGARHQGSTRHLHARGFIAVQDENRQGHLWVPIRVILAC